MMINIEIDKLVQVANNVTVKEIFLKDHAPFKASFFTIQPNGISPLDSHKVKEVWIVTDGVGELTCDNQMQIIQKGSVVYFDPFETHSIKNPANSDLNIISIWWD